MSVLIVHLLAGLALGIPAVLWAWAEGLRFWTAVALHVTAANLGTVLSAVLLTVARPVAPGDGASDGAASGAGPIRDRP